MTYLDLLSPWPASVRPHLYRFPDNPNLACYGPGNHGHWALQANTTAASAFAVLAMDQDVNEKAVGMSQDEILDWALSMIRFTFATHLSGSQKATDGKQWGHSWISALCLERLMHGIEALGEQLTHEDKADLNRVLVSEADWLLDHYTVVAGVVENNKPESNLWNGALLHRAALMVPDAARASLFKEKGSSFLVNGISKESDRHLEEIISGKPISKWHVGGNMTPEMGCNHHGYQNVGYMVICLSQIAMMHFSCKANGWDAPEGLYHHAEELWQVVKACTFDDGRLFRIGGDTRVRYCYCQDYAIPTWLWARDYLGDRDTLVYETGWQDQLQKEVNDNQDGTFLSQRLAGLKKVSPLYYLRLEGDRACTLGMGTYWNKKYKLNDVTGTTKPKTLPSWHDDYHGSCLARGEKRMASWTWRAAEAPQGLVVPMDQSAMAEWQGNLAGRVFGVGRLNTPQCIWKQADCFEGGFATCGQVIIRTHAYVAEGELDVDVAKIDLACVALPDDRTVVIFQRASALGRPYFREIKGLFLQVGNDLFNQQKRILTTHSGEQILRSCPGKEETLAIQGAWLNIDNAFSVVRVYGEHLSIHRPADRQITIQAKPNHLHVLSAGGNYYAEEICCGLNTEVHAQDADAQLFDLGAVLLSGLTAEQTRSYSEENPPLALECNHPDLRGIQVTDAVGVSHTILANFSDKDVLWKDHKLKAHQVQLLK